MFRMCVHIKWFWKFWNILDFNFLRQIINLWKSSVKAKASDETFLHVDGEKKKAQLSGSFSFSLTHQKTCSVYTNSLQSIVLLLCILYFHNI